MFSVNSYRTLENCLSGAFKLTKYPDIDEYKYSGYGIEFNRKEKFSVSNGFGRNCIIFGVDMSSSLHVHNKEKDILLLGEGITQELDSAALAVNFTEKI